MLAGPLNKRVWIQARAVTESAGGAPVDNYADVVEVWASIEPLQPREYLAAAAINSDITTKIRIRKRDGVDATTRLRWSHGGSPEVSEYFDVEGPPIEVLTNRTEIWLMCKKRTTPGFRSGVPR